MLCSCFLGLWQDKQLRFAKITQLHHYFYKAGLFKINLFYTIDKSWLIMKQMISQMYID